MNRGELETLIAGYLHRDDLAADIPGFIDIATARIGRDLRSAENETVFGSFSPELVNNGNFTDGTAGWSPGTLSLISVTNNQMTVDRNSNLLTDQCFSFTPPTINNVDFNVVVDLASETHASRVSIFGRAINDLPLGQSSHTVNGQGDNKIDLEPQRSTTAISVFNSISVKEALTTFTPIEAVSELPEDFRNMKELSYSLGDRRVVLKASSPGFMSKFPQTGSAPAFYRISGTSIEIRPFQAKEFRLSYFNAPASLSGSVNSENAVLTAYPQIYLYASLIEAYFFTQDAGGHALAVETYTSEVAAENKRTENADIGDRPSIQGG